VSILHPQPNTLTHFTTTAIQKQDFSFGDLQISVLAQKLRTQERDKCRELTVVKGNVCVCVCVCKLTYAHTYRHTNRRTVQNPTYNYAFSKKATGYMSNVKALPLNPHAASFIQGVPGGMCQTSGVCSLC